VGEPGEVGDVELARVRAEQDVDAVDLQDLERGAAHRLEDRLGVERLPDALVEGGEGAGLLVVEPLGLQVPRPSTATQSWRPTVSRKRSSASSKVAPGGAATLRTPRLAPLKARGTLAWATGLREPGPDHRHAGALGGVAGLEPVARGEDLPAQALAEPAGPGEVEVRRRDPRWAARRSFRSFSSSRKTQAASRAEAVEQGLEGRVEDRLDVLLPVKAHGDVGEDPQLPLPLPDASSSGLRREGLLGHRGILRQVLRHARPS
jgi:hypothetical protein